MAGDRTYCLAVSADRASVGYKKLILCLIAVLICFTATAQTSDDQFRNAQMSFGRVSDAYRKYNEKVCAEFRNKKIPYPPRDIYIRAFKSQNELELWARANEVGEYTLVKTFHICAISGLLGPKRHEGDKQVPEGFYFIEDFNPASEYFLSLQLNYPNFADRKRGKMKPGGGIYIHGGCVTTGCMPMTNEGIEEIYTICLNARANGQLNIPVHIYPTRLNKSGINYLNHEFANDVTKMQFWAELQPEYEYFEKTHKLLPVMYTPEGKYVN